MKQQRPSNPVLQENSVPKRHCMVCNKAAEGWYGAHGNTGTCSAACERAQEARPKFPDHPSEAFEMLHNL